MEFFLIYLFMMVEKIGVLLTKGYGVGVVGLICLAATVIIAGMVSVDEKDENDKSIKLGDKLKQPFYKAAKRLSTFFAVFGFIVGIMGDLLPNQKELAIIIGSGVTYNLITSEPAKRMGGKAVEILEGYIDNALKDVPTPEEAVKKGKAVIIEKIEGEPLK